MLLRIKQVSGLGVFDGYRPHSTTGDFERYNIIYGPNGSGKTTLTRLFSALATGGHPDYPELEFVVETQAGPIKGGYKKKVRIFNADYIDANIGQFRGPLRHILIVGEENKTLAEEAAVEQRLYDDRMRRIGEATVEIEKLEVERGKVFSAIAKTIGEATSGSSMRTYRKPDAEAAFGRTKDFRELTQDKLSYHRETIRQIQLGPIKVPDVIISNAMAETGGLLEEMVDAAVYARLLIAQTSQAGALKRLIEMPIIARWVEDGLRIHIENTSERCEFCDAPLDEARLSALSNHFGAEDQRLKKDIEEAIQRIEGLRAKLAGIDFPAKEALYGEIQTNYVATLAAADRARSELDTQLETVKATLRTKLDYRSVGLDTTIAVDCAAASAAFAELQQVLEQHNKKTGDFELEKAASRAAIEEHYLATIVEQIISYNADISASRAKIVELKEGDIKSANSLSLGELKASYERKLAHVSSAHAGSGELTARLKTFLGRTELRFESTSEGYNVLRRGKPAKRLSEGEKMAIAFIYFTVHLHEDFDAAEGVVIIDDPISSMDSASIYQAFAFLKQAVMGAGQVFLLTHNFDFLRLLVGWFKHMPKSCGSRRYLMILCSDTEECRRARIIPLDPLLLNHPTEYCYLFKTLLCFESDGTIEGSYHVLMSRGKYSRRFSSFMCLIKTPCIPVWRRLILTPSVRRRFINS